MQFKRAQILKESLILQLILLLTLLSSLVILITSWNQILIDLLIKNFFRFFIPYEEEINIIFSIFIRIIITLMFIWFLQAKITSNGQGNKKFVILSKKNYLIIFFLILGFFAYLIHLLVYFFGQFFVIRGILFTEGHSFTNRTIFQYILLILYIVVFIPILEEFLFRKTLLNYILNLKFGLFTSSLLISSLIALPFMWNLIVFLDSTQIMIFLIIKFFTSFVLSCLYFLTRKLIQTSFLNMTLSSYLLLHQIAFDNLKNAEINEILVLIKLIIIYSAFTLAIAIFILYYFSKLKVTLNDELKNLKPFLYPKQLINRNVLYFGLILLVLLPNGLIYFLSNIFVFKPMLEPIILKIFVTVVVTISLTLIYRQLVSLNAFKFEIEPTIDNLFTLFTNSLTTIKIKVKSLFKSPFKANLNFFLNYLFKSVFILGIFLPLIILTVKGTIKTKLFNFFNINTVINLNLNLHLLFSVFDVKTNIGFSTGTKGIVFLKNIDKKYFFLPTSYYSDPVDWFYGLFGSLIWIYVVILLFSVVKTILRSDKTPKQKLKSILKYVFYLIIWNIFNFGLFKPSSFIPTPKAPGEPTQPSGSSFLSNFSLEDLQIIFLPIGIIILLGSIFYYSIATIIKKDEKIITEKEII